MVHVKSLSTLSIQLYRKVGLIYLVGVISNHQEELSLFEQLSQVHIAKLKLVVSIPHPIYQVLLTHDDAHKQLGHVQCNCYVS